MSLTTHAQALDALESAVTGIPSQKAQQVLEGAGAEMYAEVYASSKIIDLRIRLQRAASITHHPAGKARA